MEYILHENAQEKSFIVKSLLSSAKNSEEAKNMLKDHLRVLSSACDESLANVDLSLIMNPQKSVNDIFIHYLICVNNKKQLESLDFVRKLKEYEDRILHMIDQYYVIKEAQPAAEKKLKLVNIRHCNSVMDRNMYQRILDRVIYNVDSITQEIFPNDEARLNEFKSLIVESVQEHCRRQRECRSNERNDFGEKAADKESQIEPIDYELAREISYFLRDADKIMGVLLHDEQRQNVSEKYYSATRSLLMHIISQAAQYWDAASAIDLLAEMKTKLEAINTEISVKIDEYYTARQHILEATDFLRILSYRIAPKRLSGFRSLEEYHFFFNFNEYFD
uniref:PhoU domain-containing protein n=1 Tax=Caenorhabditis tropicalis TaxID=1561998 RepID=A0A1I7TZ23_9PELO